MEKLLLLLIVPLCWPIFSRFVIGHSIDRREVLAQTGITTVMVLIMYWMLQFTSMTDIEVWNGSVIDKEKVRVSCSHSYQCNCQNICSGTGNNRTCTRVCQICYMHTNDWDWRVYTSVGTLNIARIDSRGSDMPPRWKAVEVGEPASSHNRYDNYIKAAPDSLFLQKAEYDQFTIPKYPKVFDYYRYFRVINNAGVDGTFINSVNSHLNDTLKHMGAAKEVNIIVVFTDSIDTKYRYALEAGWLGGKKNDVIVIVGAPNPPEIAWADVITFGQNYKNETLAVVLRDKLQAETLDNAEEFAYNITSAVGEHYNRVPMEDFSYLKDDVEPSMLSLIICFIISIVASIGLTYYFKNN